MIIGLAGQSIHYRQPVPKNENRCERQNRFRKSEIWGKVIQEVGAPQESVQFTHVFDRGADNFEVFCHLLEQETDWVIRAAQLKRSVTTQGEEKLQLREHLATLPVSGTCQLEVPANTKQAARTATVAVRFSTIGMQRPRNSGHYGRSCGINLITMNVVEVRELNPPRKETPLHWVLFTSHPVATFEDAWKVIGFYEQRPLIEEFHKALKTGCSVEERLYETAHPWATLTAFLSIVAVRLLKVKTVAKADPERPAEEVVPRKWIQMLSAVKNGKHKNIRTVRDFLRGMAGFGGHLGRKYDGEPGWITRWGGFRKLNLLIRGYEAMNKKCR